jgi:transcriptional regulator with XRE-family HTH domain
MENMGDGDKLRWLRTECGLSIEKAAEISGFSTPHIKKVEGGHSPTLVCLRALLGAYGSNTSEYFESISKVQNEEDRQLFERLQFILDQARREDASKEEMSRADCIRGSIDEFYRNAVRPVGRVTRRQRRGGGVEAAKPQIQNKIHGRFKGPTTAGKFPD